MAALVVIDAALIQKTRENQGVVVRADSFRGFKASCCHIYCWFDGYSGSVSHSSYCFCVRLQDTAEGMFQVGQEPGAGSGDEPAAKRARQ